MAVVAIRVTGEDASEVATVLEHLLRDICQLGLAVVEAPDDEAALSCETHAPAGGLAEVQQVAAAVLGGRRAADRFLRQRHPLLDRWRPLDVLRDDKGGPKWSDGFSGGCCAE